MEHTSRIDDAQYIKVITSLETGEVIPNVEFMIENNITLAECFGVALGTHQMRSIVACMKVMEDLNFFGLSRFSEDNEGFQDLGKPDDELLLVVEGRYFLNSNHPYCLPYADEERLQTMNVFYTGPNPEDWIPAPI